MGSTHEQLSPQRAQALFDLLIHNQTYYDDCVRFNRVDGIDKYGPPFSDGATAESSQAPILQTLLYRFVLPLPGVRSFSDTFWTNVETLMRRFAAANLSDSYDHAGLGFRRTLATGGAALLEYPAKGVFARVAKREGHDEEYQNYDLNDPEDLRDAWNEFLDQIVYGEMIETLFDKAAETDTLSDHDNLVQAAHEYLLIHAASVLHYVFIESPDAIYAQKLVSNLLKLIPWAVLRQSLRIGNAASMISAVTKLFLTKLSLTSITNWFGLSNNPDDGMNLFQQIISTILSWDTADYEKNIQKIRKSKTAPSNGHFSKLDEYIEFSQDVQEALRNISLHESKSMVTVILENASLPILEGEAHDNAVQYLALRSSVRDREQISKITCKGTPDVLTQTLREAIAAYDPIIRGVHQAVDLSAGCLDLEYFLADFAALFEKQPVKNGLKPGGSRTPGTRTPGTSTPGTRTPKTAQPTEESQLKHTNVTIEQFANVLRKHQNSVHKFLHQMAKNGGDITSDYLKYAKVAASNFRTTSKTTTSSQPAAGDFTEHLNKLVSDLPESSRSKVLDAVDGYAAYLSVLECVTTDRLRGVLLEGDSPPAGPGGFLARWQALLDSSATTPLTPHGKVQYGSSRVHDSKIQNTLAYKLADQWRWPDPPDTKIIVDKLGPQFKTLVADLGREHWRRYSDLD